MQEWDALRDWTGRVAGIELTDGQVDQLRRYVDVLRLWSRKVALVSRRDLEKLLVKHLPDALFAAAHCRQSATVADLGSGAGLPGLVVAVADPSLHVTLVEARGRKVSFLEEACRATEAVNARVVQARIETLAHDPAHRHRYGAMTARALADLESLVSLATPLAAAGGRLIAMCGPDGDVPRAPVEQVPYVLPDGTPRRLVILALPRPTT